MSVPEAPYISPYQTGFTRYPVQLIPLTTISTNEIGLTVTAGFWWRIIYVTAEFVTGATVDTRIVELQIHPPDNQPVYLQAATDNQPQNATFNYVFGPTITAYKSTAIAAKGICVQTIPDLLWQPKTKISVVANSFDAGDSWGPNTNALAAEVYTQDYDSGKLVPAELTATPALA